MLTRLAGRRARNVSLGLRWASTTPQTTSSGAEAAAAGTGGPSKAVSPEMKKYLDTQARFLGETVSVVAAMRDLGPVFLLPLATIWLLASILLRRGWLRPAAAGCHPPILFFTDCKCHGAFAAHSWWTAHCRVGGLVHCVRGRVRLGRLRVCQAAISSAHL